MMYDQSLLFSQDLQDKLCVIYEAVEMMLHFSCCSPQLRRAPGKADQTPQIRNSLETVANGM